MNLVHPRSVWRPRLTRVAAVAALAVGLASPSAWSRPTGPSVKPPSVPTTRPRPSQGLAGQNAGVTSLSTPRTVVSTQAAAVSRLSTDP